MSVGVDSRSYRICAYISSILISCAQIGLSALQGQAQESCKGTSLSGTIRDTTRALVPHAEVVLDEREHQTTGDDGSFHFLCVAGESHHLTINAPSFATQTIRIGSHPTDPVNVILHPDTVTSEMNVDSTEQSAHPNGAGMTFSGDRLKSLADDPDDLLHQLQQLAAVLGGSPNNTIIAVDGFQGASKLPSKASISYIEINPDLFSSEYGDPPFGGGRVEVYTKPGQDHYHGALFATNSSAWENARDPLSGSKAALGKQRYGFELAGPILKAGSNFALSLEHRSIDNFAVVDAVTFSAQGNAIDSVANVSTPQRLWIGTARSDWQLGEKNTFSASYSANVNQLDNLGVGGLSLAETGYNSQQYEHVMRFSDVTLLSAAFMHETHLSLRWDGEDDQPASTAPQVQVAGAFISGGASLGAQQLHELNIELDDDALLKLKHHTLKFGTQMMIYDEHQQLTTNFNGTYIFGGGGAPVLDSSNQPVSGQTETITGVEQYRRSLLSLPGGAPTAFTQVQGTPQVNFAQVQDALFVQDEWVPNKSLTFVLGLRYFLQTDPTILGAITPRAGVLWSLLKDGALALHAHAGLFSDPVKENITAEVLREDGMNRVTSTVYNPTYLNPYAGAIPILSVRQFVPHISNSNWSLVNAGFTSALFHGTWNFTFDYYLGRIWNDTRTKNINAPLTNSPTGPRPGASDVDILQLQNSGQGHVNSVSASVEEHAIKRLQIVFGAARLNIVDDTDDNDLFTPQSTYSDAGEFAHRSGQPVWNLFGSGTLTLPAKITVSTSFTAGGDSHYNVTTGFDNNGDGDFNDRPQYGAQGAQNAVATTFGVLVAAGGIGVLPRNKGVLPWSFYLDGNVERAFSLSRDPKAAHPQALTVNLRSSNVLNHTNVTQIGGILGSPLFGAPTTADNGRRVEGGLRFSF